MSLIDNIEVPRREMVLFFIADKSGSMAGTKIQSLNQAIKEVIPMLDEISGNNADAQIRIAALEFSSGCKWMYDEPKLASDFIWQDLSESGLTDLGLAFEELNSKLSRKLFMKAETGAFAPVIILMTDGEPTDDYKRGIEKLKGNKWFLSAIKIAIAIGNDANKEVLKEFTGSVESVIEVHNVETLKKIIRLASVTASTIGSQSSTAGNKTKQEIVDEVLAEATSVETDDDWD